MELHGGSAAAVEALSAAADAVAAQAAVEGAAAPHLRLGLLLVAEEQGFLSLEGCTVRWLSTDHDKPTDVVHMVRAQVQSRVHISRCEISVAPSRKALEVPFGVYALEASSVVVRQCVLHGCFVSLENSSSLMASHMVVEAPELGQPHPSGAPRNQHQQHHHHHHSSGSSSSRDSRGSEDDQAEEARGGPGNTSSCNRSWRQCLTNGLSMQGGCTARLTSCCIRGFTIAVVVRRACVGLHACVVRHMLLWLDAVLQTRNVRAPCQQHPTPSLKPCTLLHGMTAG